MHCRRLGVKAWMRGVSEAIMVLKYICLVYDVNHAVGLERDVDGKEWLKDG